MMADGLFSCDCPMAKYLSLVILLCGAEIYMYNLIGLNVDVYSGHLSSRSKRQPINDRYCQVVGVRGIEYHFVEEV